MENSGIKLHDITQKITIIRYFNTSKLQYFKTSKLQKPEKGTDHGFQTGRLGTLGKER